MYCRSSILSGWMVNIYGQSLFFQVSPERFSWIWVGIHAFKVVLKPHVWWSFVLGIIVLLKDEPILRSWTLCKMVLVQDVNVLGCILLLFASNWPVPSAEKNTHSMLPPLFFTLGKLLGMRWAVPAVLYKYHMEFGFIRPENLVSQSLEKFFTVKLPTENSSIKPRQVEGCVDSCLSRT